MREEIRNKLYEMSDAGYQEFSASLIPASGRGTMLGVRLPALRTLAKEIAKGDFRKELSYKEDLFFEETMLRGMILGYGCKEIQELFSYLEDFIPRVQNWSVCDSACSTIKLARSQPEEFWEFLQQYLNSREEFQIRFGLVQLLDYYVNETYLERVLEAVQQVQQEAYYVNMAQAWAISICYREFPEATLPVLKKNTLNDFTHNKAIQKITESLKVSGEKKELVKTLRRQ